MNGMKRRWVQMALASVLGSAIAASLSALEARPAHAQAAYGTYVGIGGAVPITSDGDTGEGGGFSGVIAGRYRFLRMPISIRAQAFVFGSNFALVPTISYDYPVTWNMDVYLGAGFSFASGDDPSPVGNQNAFVLQPGLDYMFPNSHLAAFTNAVIAFNGYRDGGNTAVSIQAGMGYQF